MTLNNLLDYSKPSGSFLIKYCKFNSLVNKNVMHAIQPEGSVHGWTVFKAPQRFQHFDCDDFAYLHIVYPVLIIRQLDKHKRSQSF